MAENVEEETETARMFRQAAEALKQKREEDAMTVEERISKCSTYSFRTGSLSSFLMTVELRAWLNSLADVSPWLQVLQAMVQGMGRRFGSAARGGEKDWRRLEYVQSPSACLDIGLASECSCRYYLGANLIQGWCTQATRRQYSTSRQ